MTDEEKKEYRAEMIELCKKYCHIDYDDDAEIVELMFDTTMEGMEELIPSFTVRNIRKRRQRSRTPFPPCY